MKLFEFHNGFGQKEATILAMSPEEAKEKFLLSYQQHWNHPYPQPDNVLQGLKELKFNIHGVQLPAGNWELETRRTLDEAL